MEWGEGYVLVQPSTGKQVGPVCEAIDRYSDGLYAVQQNGLWGYLDIDGTQEIPCQYQQARPFCSNLAAVQNTDGLWGVYQPGGHGQGAVPVSGGGFGDRWPGLGQDIRGMGRRSYPDITEENTMKQWNVAILGTGAIAAVMADTLNGMEEARLYAVGSRTLDRARAFAEKIRRGESLRAAMKN